MRPVNFSLEAQELLGRLHDETQSPEEKERFIAAIDALRFIYSTGQSYDFEDYRKSIDDKAPPLVIATFNTRQEADTWLKEHTKPPDGANVLIAGEYHTVVYAPERKHRSLPPNPFLEFYLKDMIEDGLPAPVATFDTHEEARTWVDSQPEPPRQVFIQIAGEYHLVAYHHRVGLRAIYPISRAAKPSPPEGEAGA